MSSDLAMAAYVAEASAEGGLGGGWDSDDLSKESALKKRKFVSDEKEEAVEEEENNNNNNNDDKKPPRDIDSDSESEYETEELKDQFRRYNKQIIESEGFDVDFVPNVSFFGGVRPVNLENDNSLSTKWVKDCVFFAIKEHNKRERADLQLESIVKANYSPAAGKLFYITLQARESSSGPVLTYQTKVFWGWTDKHVIEVDLFRPKREVRAAN